MAVACASCATVATGGMQTISVQSTPDGAACVLTREGEQLARVVTPASVTISRSRKSVQVACTKVGFVEGRTIFAAGAEPGTFLDDTPLPVLGLGQVVNLASGASSRYPSTIQVSLSPEGSTPPSAPSVATPSLTPAAAASTPPGPFDGSYSGKTLLRALLTGNSTDVNYQINVTVVGGKGTGTASSSACPFPGDVSLAIGTAGNATGEIDLRRDSSCAPNRRKAIGRVENGSLRLVFEPIGRAVLTLVPAPAQ